MKLSNAFKPDYKRYEGLRPIIVHAMRLGYALVFMSVGSISWMRIVHYRGVWDPVQAAALCMWAAHALLSLIGIFQPLKMLPLVLFEIVYKLFWLAIVAWPLWAAGQLAGSPSEDMAYSFLAVVIPIAFVPWRYVFHKYIWSRPAS